MNDYDGEIVKQFHVTACKLHISCIMIACYPAEQFLQGELYSIVVIFWKVTGALKMYLLFYYFYSILI